MENTENSPSTIPNTPHNNEQPNIPNNTADPKQPSRNVRS